MATTTSRTSNFKRWLGIQELPLRQVSPKFRLLQLEDRTVPANLITIQSGGLLAIPVGATTYLDTMDYSIDPSALNSSLLDVTLRANLSINFLDAVSLANNGVSLDAESKDGLTVQATLNTAAGGNIRLSGTAAKTAIGLLLQSDVSSGGNVALIGVGGTEGGGFDAGVSVVGTVTAASTMTVNGTGGQGFNGSNPGINIDGSLVSNGDLTLVGVGGAGGFSSGVIAFTNLTSTTGTIRITGTGGTGTTEVDGINVGVFLFNTVVTAGGAGGVILDGTGGSGPVGSNDGVLFSTATVNATAGPLVATGRAGFGDDSFGVRHSGGDTKAPNITLISDNLDIDSSSTLTATGTATVRPLTAGRAIVLGGADSMTALGLADIELSRFFVGTLRIGSAAAGSISSTAAVNPLNTTKLDLLSGAAITGGSGVTDVTVANLTLTAVSGIGAAGAPFRTAVGNLTANNSGVGGINISELDAVTILGVTASNGAVVVDSGGAMTLAGAVNASGNSVMLNRTIPMAGKSLFPGVAGVDIDSANSSIGGSLNITILGNVADTLYSRLRASGTIDLTNSTLTLSGAYVPASAEVFTIVTGASVTGTFSGLPNNSTIVFNGRTLRLNYSATEVTLTTLPTVVLSVSTSSGTEAGSTVITVTATTDGPVRGNQSVSLNITGTASPSDYALSNTTITILDGQSSGSVTFTVVNDAFDEDTETAILTISNPSNGILLGTVLTQSINIADDDTAGFTVTPTSGLTTTESGGTATFSVVLNSQPTANVTIQLMSSNTAEGTISMKALTFTPANWNVPQTVVVTGVNDPFVDGNTSYSIVTSPAVSSDPKYAGIDPSDVSLSNLDNDTRATIQVVTPGLDETGTQVVIFDAGTLTRLRAITPFPGFRGNLSTASGDVNGDGLPDIVVGAGFGGGPHVKVFDGANGAEIRSFFAFAEGFSGGVSVGVGDVNGDVRGDLVVGAGPGGGPHVKVFDGRTGQLISEFFAYDKGFRGGLSVAVGDVTGDGRADIVTGAGPGGGPHVKVFNGTTGAEVRSFFPYSTGFTGGVSVAIGDLNDDDFGDIITGTGPGGGPHVKAFSGRTSDVLADFFAYATDFTGGVDVAGVDTNSDGLVDIVTGAGPGGGPHVKIFNSRVFVEPKGFFATDLRYNGGVYVG